jgi:signal transduction histidine kinase
MQYQLPFLLMLVGPICAFTTGIRVNQYKLFSTIQYGHFYYLSLFGLLVAEKSCIFKRNQIRPLFHGVITLYPLVTCIWMAHHIIYTNCGGICEPREWMPQLRLVSVVPILGGMFSRLPFWRLLFWSRIVILVAATMSWHHIMEAAGPEGREVIYIPFHETLGICFAGLLCAWEREHCGRKLFSLKYSESTTILGSVSHDLKTPIHAISSIVTHLLERDDPSTQKELRQALHGCKRMAGLVDDLMLVSTLYNTDGTGLVISPEAIDVRKFLAEQQDLVRPMVQGLVHLSLDVDSMVPKVITIDPARLSQITTNLLTNAAKFTQRGCIRYSSSSSTVHHTLYTILMVSNAGSRALRSW